MAAIRAVEGLRSSFMVTLVPIQSQLPQLLNASCDDTAWVVDVDADRRRRHHPPIAGCLDDVYGKRRIVRVLLIVTMLGSVLAALSIGIIGMMIGPMLHGAAVGVVPLCNSITCDVPQGNRIDVAIAVVSTTLGIGGAEGLVISVLVAENTDWHWLLWIAGGLGAIVFLLSLWIVPVSVLRTAGRSNYLGATGLAIGPVGLRLAVSRRLVGGTAPLTLGLAVGGHPGSARVGLCPEPSLRTRTSLTAELTSGFWRVPSGDLMPAENSQRSRDGSRAPELSAPQTAPPTTKATKKG